MEAIRSFLSWANRHPVVGLSAIGLGLVILSFSDSGRQLLTPERYWEERVAELEKSHAFATEMVAIVLHDFQILQRKQQLGLIRPDEFRQEVDFLQKGMKSFGATEEQIRRKLEGARKELRDARK